ncbi:putative peptide import ATP-binding protein [Geobacter sp. OR-1]|uniref:ABC transporter ATP-binding protein n=1 Tax=Geobacter sp. OR-1 TaxID=1266765 RepID=UPI0005443D3C|nr:ABC transporter ATP-binding protein [Geobacter sp. OR-1]GAM08058.1 putative peptide import ATP-binding protein [Geobacter sp. OR-1]
MLEVRDLSVCINSAGREVRAIKSVSFNVAEGETLAIVGESGCGKSMTALSLLRLLPPGGRIDRGSITLDGVELTTLSETEMRRIRGSRISMIFQEPMTSLNPVLTIGAQVSEGLRLHRGLSKQEAFRESVSLLHQVGIPSPEARCGDYPHQLSGGMRQRVMIAMALSCKPLILIADEPTTALDVTIQAQILDLLNQVKRESGMGMILISHDLGIVAENAARTAIMYAGTIVESASTKELFDNPLHPYTKGLLDSLPQKAAPGIRLPTIPGQVPGLDNEVRGCGFCDRCRDPEKECRIEPPPVRETANGHMVRCWKKT